MDQECSVSIEIQGKSCFNDEVHPCIGHIGLSKDFPSLIKGLTETIGLLQDLLNAEIEAQDG